MMTMPINGINWMQTVAPYAAESWIASLWQGMILALAVWFCLKLLPRISASTRFVVWIITFFTITLLPFLRLLPVSLSVEHVSVAQAFVPVPHTLVQLNARWALAITGIWFAAVLFEAVRLVLDLRRLRSIHKTSVPIAIEELNPELQSILGVAINRKLQLRISETVDTPSAIGFLKPAVVIPRWLWEEFSPAQLKHVLVHEVAHLRRYDDWTNLLQKLVRTLLPVNPALYWVEKHLCFERELACDDAVLSAEVTPRDYATCLTTLAGKKLGQRSVALAPGAIEKQSDLARRVYSLLSRTRNSSLLVARGVAAGFLFATVSGAVAFTQCPQWISFAAPEELSAAALHADKIVPGAKLQLASMRMPEPLNRSKSNSIKPRHAVSVHKSAPKDMPVIAAISGEHGVSEHQAAGQKASVIPASVTSGVENNRQVFIVLSVWQATSGLQVNQTALIFTESKAASSKPAKSDSPVHQSWLILQI